MTHFSQEEQQKILAADRSNNLLNTDKLEHLFPKVINIKMLHEYKKNSTCDKINLLITGGCGFICSTFINYYFQRNKVNLLVNLDAMYYCAEEKNQYEQTKNIY